MAQKTCPSCAGFGDYPSTERIPSPGGGMFQEISVRKSCEYCGGSGTVWEQDPLPSYASEGDASSTASHPRQRKPGLIDHLVGLGMWWVEKIWPLRIFSNWGQQLLTVGWKMKLLLSLGGAAVGVSLFVQNLHPFGLEIRAPLLEVAGESAGLWALGLGAIGGWLLPPVLGAFMTLSNRLLALGIGLLITVVGLAVVYSLIALFTGWPSLDQYLPQPIKERATEWTGSSAPRN